MLILQLTDFHAVAEGKLVGGVDTRLAFTQLLRSVAQLDPRPDMIVVSGDVGDDGTDAEYAFVAAGLRGLGVPFVVVPGNHDLREPLRRAFSEEMGRAASHLAFQRHIGGVRIIGLDTLVEGHAHGALSDEQLHWLEKELNDTGTKPTLIVMHHPPCQTGIPSMDAIGLRLGREWLMELLERRADILGILSGHVHRAIFTRLAQIPVVIAPSATYQFALDFVRTGVFEIVQEPPQLMLHQISEGKDAITSYLVPA
ncbi:phosphodiesterase [Bosea sp. BH3]|uniref:phosphodiesterase n=1 Tax=Bosea sp. BH3 TaxID=2871701 RepID=UPI0021CAEB71|nr:phosphodiesterase [Bosea sp. BH3]MCU4179879.1 phosphodiesterase [Bosea sp. BH3]